MHEEKKNAGKGVGAESADREKDIKITENGKMVYKLLWSECDLSKSRCMYFSLPLIPRLGWFSEGDSRASGTASNGSDPSGMGCTLGCKCV